MHIKKFVSVLICLFLTINVSSCSFIDDAGKVVGSLWDMIVHLVEDIFNIVDDEFNEIYNDPQNIIWDTDYITTSQQYFYADYNNFGVEINQPGRRSLISSISPTEKELVYADGLDILEKYNRNFITKTPSVGNPRFLVVPVLFNGTTLNPDKLSNDGCREMLTKAFFGSSNTVDYESVSSFYSKASFGACNIQGTVSPVFTTTFTYEDLYYASETDGDIMVDMIFEEIYDGFFGTNCYSVSDFDSNNDNFIDGICAVYLNDQDSSTSLWNYCSYTKYECMSHYMWCSFNNLDYINDPTTDVFIHETGHMLGLADYYNTYDQNLNNPTGGIDVMDYNVGAQNAFSCYSLGWVIPKVVDLSIGQKDIYINLRPFVDSGDCLIVANDFNNTCFDEYLMIEFYAPTGLNNYNFYNANVENGEFSGELTDYGIQIYHVDNRLMHMIYVENEGWKSTGQYQDRIFCDENNFSRVAATNGHNKDNSSYYGFSPYYLISLLDGSAVKGNNKFIETDQIADNSSLFKVCSFSNIYPNFKFNDTQNLAFNIQIYEITTEYVSLRVFMDSEL